MTVPEHGGSLDDLEARVAALEGLARAPLPMQFSEEQAGELRQQREAACAGPQEYKILPQPPPLTPDELRQVLRECVTVVRPGEVLVIRAPEDFTPDQLREYQEYVAWWLEYNAPEVRCLVTIGEELGVARYGSQ
jgi:hypothetical protein